MAEFSGSPMILAYLDANFGESDTEEAIRKLVTNVDDSPYSLRQWVESLMVFGQWLDVRGLTLPLEEQIGYVCCAAEASVASSTMTHLPDLVGEMLEAYGCERSVEKIDAPLMYG